MDDEGPDVVDAGGVTVWRVGRFRDPWTWTPREFSGSNRWDDAGNVFRTVYVGDTSFACFMEVLAFARPDPTVDGGLSAIVEYEQDDGTRSLDPAGGGSAR